MMVHGGHGYRSRVELEIGRKQFIDRWKDRNSVFLRGVGGTRGIRFHGRRKNHALAGAAVSRRFQLAIHAQMIAAERAGPDHGNPQNGSACYLVTPASFVTPVSGLLPSTAFRQRL